MAGSLTVTATDVAHDITKYSLAWTSDSSGDVSGTSATFKAGSVVAVTVSPGSGGSQPSNAYDVTMLCDIHGIDVLYGEGPTSQTLQGSTSLSFRCRAQRTRDSGCMAAATPSLSPLRGIPRAALSTSM